MGLQINQNIAALTAHKNLGISDARLSQSLERLSSGLRINRAADDAAGLTISEKLRSQVRGLQQASRNAQDGVSLVQTAEGGLSEVHSLLQRMRELAVQASNDTLTNTDRVAITSETADLSAEINRIAGSTEFNTKGLLNGDMESLVENLGADLIGGAIGITDVNTNGAAIGTNYEITVVANGGSWDISVTNGEAAPDTVSETQTVNAPVSGSSSVSFSSLGIELEFNSALAASTPGAATFDVGGSVSQLWVGANGAGSTNQSIAFSIEAVTTVKLGIDVMSVADQVSATEAIDLLDVAIGKVSTTRSSLGSLQNRLDHAIANISISVENLSASESRIRDLDVASEMITFTRNQIMVQAGTAMLAQANAVPQTVLSLLRG